MTGPITTTTTGKVASTQLDPNLASTGPVTPVAPALPGAVTPPAPDGTQEQRDAVAEIRSVLAEYGLEGEADWAWNEIVTGKGKTQIMQDLRQRDSYKQRFSGMGLRTQNGLSAISEADYIMYERQAYQLMKAAGMPGEFSTQDYIAQLIGVDKSINEVNQIITNAYLAVTQAPAEVRQTFAEFFGPSGDSALAAMMLDPKQSDVALERMANTAIVGGTGRQYGFQVGQGLADQIVARGLTNQSRQNFEQLAASSSLFTETATENTDLTTTQGVEAAFGTDMASREAVRKRQEERSAAFAGRDQTVTTQQGAIGLGSARQ